MGDGEGYVRKVQESTQKYLEDLLAQGDRMRGLVSTLEDEKRRLGDELETLRTEMSRQREERERLQTALLEMETENRSFVERFAAVQQQNSNLANLYVASFRLHGTLDAAEVEIAIEEIVANLIGCEEMAIFEVASGGDRLDLIRATGVDADPLRRLSTEEGLLGKAARTGQRWLRGMDSPEGELAAEKQLTACVPLVLGDTVMGLLALFKLLPQKSAGYQDLDLELMDLLASHAATALYCSRRIASGAFSAGA
jgi:GAF domain-containing protein